MHQPYEFFETCFIHLGNVFPGPIHWMKCIWTTHFTVRKQRYYPLDLSWGRRWTQMIVCNRVTMLIHGNHFICMDEIQFGGPYDISKLWYNRSGRDSAPKRHNTEGVRSPLSNLKWHCSVSRNKQLSMRIGIFLFLHQIWQLRWMKLLWLRKLTEKPLSVSQKDADSEFDEIIFAKHRRVTHAMIVVDSESPDAPQHLNKYWRPACGTHMSHEDTKFLSEWDHTMSFCQHPGCKKAWAAAGMFWSGPRTA